MRSTAGNRWAAGIAAVGLGIVAPWPSPGASATPPAQDCVAETFTWFGQRVVEPGASIEVGVIAAVVPGVQIVVTATDSSPVVVPIQIGGAAATAGSSVLGGAVVVTNIATDPIELSSVAVGFDRCRQVASEAVPVTTTVTELALPVQDVADLPGTGRMSRRVAVVAAATLLGGLTLVGASRRRWRAPVEPASPT